MPTDAQPAIAVHMNAATHRNASPMNSMSGDRSAAKRSQCTERPEVVMPRMVQHPYVERGHIQRTRGRVPWSTSITT